MDIPQLKIYAWNPRGIRSLCWEPNGLIEFLRGETPDIIFFPETQAKKANEQKVQLDLNTIFNQALPDVSWTWYWSYCAKSAHHGNAVAIRSNLIVEWVHYHLDKMGIPEEEGRVISVKLVGMNYVFIGLYVPNASTNLKRLNFKIEWLKKMRNLFDSYKAQGLVVIAIGDINVAPDERDLCNPSSNLKTPGYSPQEREAFAEHILVEYVDLWRAQHPIIPCKTQKQKGQYTFWTQRNGNTARLNNSGWRLDLVLMNKEQYINNDHIALICSQYKGSDHCPIGLHIKQP